MKIKKTATTSRYDQLTRDSRAMGEDNDCVVKAVSQVLRVSYREARDLCTQYGRRSGQGMYPRDWMRLLSDRGIKYSFASPTQFISRYPGVHANLKNVTTHHPDRFHKVWADGCRYLFWMADHVAYIENGVNHDWTRGRARQVKAILKIED